MFVQTTGWRWVCVLGVLAVTCAAGLAQTSGPTSRPAATAAAATEPASAATSQESTEPDGAAEGVPAVQCARIRISGKVVESQSSFSLLGDLYSPMTLQDWLQQLAGAREDARVAAVALEVDATQLGWAQAMELADAVSRINKVKPVYAYLVSGGVAHYLVASAGRDLAMEPTGELEILGLSGEMMFFRGAMDWLGVEPQFVQIGRYKGASEPFMLTGPSKEFQEIHNALLDDLYDQLCGQIARQRSLAPDDVRKAIDEGPFNAEEALKFKLIDRQMTKADWLAHVAKAVAPKGRVAWRNDYGRKDRKALNLSNPFTLLKTIFGSEEPQPVQAPAIAIIHAEGVIVGGNSGESLFGQRVTGARTLTACFDQAANDPRIKAVVFRIDSPGGSALASELIYQAVERCARKKPVIASLSSVAASGGYYVAVGAPTIIAEPCAITGSIGVVGGKLAITGLLDKLRIGTFPFTRGKNAGLNLSRPWTQEELALIRRHAMDTYQTFVRRVADSRKDKVKVMENVAEGRIFSGRQALALGLVDKLGGLKDAVQAAQAAANIKEANFINLPRPRTLLDLLSGDEDVSWRGPSGAAWGELERLVASSGLAGPSQRAGLGYLLCLAQLLGRESILAALPYHFSILE